MYQSDTKSHAGWSQNVLKYIAMGTMLLNHIATIFLPAGTVLCELFTAVGYFTAISMVYMQETIRGWLVMKLIMWLPR